MSLQLCCSPFSLPFQLQDITGAHASPALEERHWVPVWNPKYLTWHCFPTARTHGNEILMAQHCRSACRMAEGHHIWSQRTSWTTPLPPSILKNKYHNQYPETKAQDPGYLGLCYCFSEVILHCPLSIQAWYTSLGLTCPSKGKHGG